MNLKTAARVFWLPTVVSAIVLAGIGWWLGLPAFVIAVLLVVLEVTLSFDNAIVNAKVLEGMSPQWQKRFLTWGIFVAVFLTRAVLPILIVAASVAMTPLAVARIALFEPDVYGELLHASKYIIYSFGGMFLVMVSLKYFFDERKERHWLHWIERHLSRWGNIEAVEIAVALVGLLGIVWFLPGQYQTEVLFAGIVGVLLFILAQGIANSFEVEAGGVAAVGATLFIYLNILDAAFSLDSVIGAFALSTHLVIIVAGLGIGAYFVRAFTLYLVQHNTLTQLIYIEHGAHWAILGLAIAMLAGLFVEVPEPITGFVGLGFLVVAYISSIRMARRGNTHG